MTEEQQDKARKYALEYLVREITDLNELIETSKLSKRDEHLLKKRKERLHDDYMELAWVFDDLVESTEKEVVHN